MKRFIFLCSAVLFATSASASTVDFNNYPDQDDWSFSSNVVSYQGLDFTSPSDGFLLVASGPGSVGANGNGTAALAFSGNQGSPLTITQTGGGVFTLNGFDMTLSWYDTNTTDDVAVVANYDAGGTATDLLTLDQGFQTYSLDFVGVDSVTVDGLPEGAGNAYWLMDNVEYDNSASPVPEPGSFVLLGSGLLILAGLARRKCVS
ncbi:MAG: PEP-CTERM sorting domain-containing protein [Terracidiphilus sp.]|jgi:hypothetical protein